MRPVGRDGFVGRSMFPWMDGVASAWGGGRGGARMGCSAFRTLPHPSRTLASWTVWLGSLPWGSMVLAKQLFAVGFAGAQTWGLDPSSALCVCPDLSGFRFFCSTMAIIIAYLKGTHQAPDSEPSPLR